MSQSKAATGLKVQKWDAKFFQEYVQESAFSGDFGTDENSIIQLKDELTKGKGESIAFALVNRLVGAGVTGSTTLEGSEEDLYSRSHKVVVDKIRNGVVVPEIQEQYSAISLRNASKATLKTWIMEKTRNDIITALGSIHTGSAQVSYALANETQKDAWITDNNDRVQFGAAVSNYSSGDHSASLLNIDNTADKMTAALLSLAKRRALTANPKIRPIMIKGGSRWFKVYMNPLALRDLKNDSAFLAANREARARGTDNPLFTDGDYIWDGMIISQVDDIPTYAVGAGGIAVTPTFLCGAQAVGIGWAKRTTTKEEEFDYGDKKGCAVEEIRGIEKLHFGTQKTSPQASGDDLADVKQNGVFTIWTAAVADA
jgi:N4-gp56 family major capsid protein